MARTSIQADLGLDTTRFQRGLAKSQKGINNFVANGIKRFGSLAGAAGFGMLARSAFQMATNISNLSKVANSGQEEFQRFAFGAKTVGVEMDRTADILKDVSDKVGDFLQTGGGPMADFFENIAPKVGVTAEMFRDLSGPEALQLYVSSLEKANLSQNEMTFFMEAIASDATLLLPLLLDNAQAMTKLGREAEALGVIMEKDTVEGLNEATVALNKFNRQATIFAGETIYLLQKAMSAVGKAVGESIHGATDETLAKQNKAIQLFEAQKRAMRELNAEGEIYQKGETRDERKAKIEARTAAILDGLKAEKNTEKEVKDDKIESIDTEAKAKREQAAKTEAEKVAAAEKAIAKIEFIKAKELKMIKLKAKGQHEAADAIKKEISLIRKSIALSEKHGITLREAARLVQDTIDNAPNQGGDDEGVFDEGDYYGGDDKYKTLAEKIQLIKLAVLRAEARGNTEAEASLKRRLALAEKIVGIMHSTGASQEEATALANALAAATGGATAVETPVTGRDKRAAEAAARKQATADRRAMTARMAEQSGSKQRAMTMTARAAEQSGANQRKRDLLLGSVAKPDPKNKGIEKNASKQTTLLESIEREIKRNP